MEATVEKCDGKREQSELLSILLSLGKEEERLNQARPLLDPALSKDQSVEDDEAKAGCERKAGVMIKKYFRLL